MLNTSEWISWDGNKWHIENVHIPEAMAPETICGEIIRPDNFIRRLESDTIPDTGDVCLHCVRWLVMKLRTGA